MITVPPSLFINIYVNSTLWMCSDIDKLDTSGNIQIFFFISRVVSIFHTLILRRIWASFKLQPLKCFFRGTICPLYLISKESTLKQKGQAHFLPKIFETFFFHPCMCTNILHFWILTSDPVWTHESCQIVYLKTKIFWQNCWKSLWKCT